MGDWRGKDEAHSEYLPPSIVANPHHTTPPPIFHAAAAPSTSRPVVATSSSRLDIGAYIKAGQAHIFESMWQVKENMTCFDCRNSQATWISVPLGIFLCLNCAGIHRGLGTHISFIRSANLDSWTSSQLLYVLIGGNVRAREFFSQQPHLLTCPINDKYLSSVAAEYKAILQKEHDALLDTLVKQGVIPPPPAPPPASHRSPQQSNTHNNNSNSYTRKYENATSISSDEFFGDEKKNKSKRCCC